MGSPRTSGASRWQLFRKLTRRMRRSKREEREKDRGIRGTLTKKPNAALIESVGSF